MLPNTKTKSWQTNKEKLECCNLVVEPNESVYSSNRFDNEYTLDCNITAFMEYKRNIKHTIQYSQHN